jgi:biotin carboxyl carrier protein
MLQAHINERVYKIENTANAQTINEQAFEWDLLEIQNGQFSIVYKNRSFNAQVIEAKPAEKSFLLKINNKEVEVTVKDRFDLLLEQLGMSNAASSKANDLKAPMPGLIVEVKTAVGESVKKGDTLLILEAMKMENVLKATGDGRVKAIKINPKQSVEKNQVLIEFE